MKDAFEISIGVLLSVFGLALGLAWLAAIFLLPALGFFWLLGWLK